jgi:glycosyltransferase involved in cell wall biosynthesis
MMTANDNKIAVLFIDSGGGYGGPGAFLCYLLRSLNRNRFEPTVAFYFGHSAPEVDELRRMGIPVLFLSKNRDLTNFILEHILAGKSKWKWLSLAKAVIRHTLLFTLEDLPQLARLLAALKRRKIELMVLNNDVHYHRVAALAAKLTRIPCICRKAGGVGKAPRMKRILTPWIDLFIAISEDTARDQRENNPGSRRVVKVFEGIDLDRFDPYSSHPRIRAELGIPAGNKVVGYVSRLVPGKGHAEFLEAAASISRQRNDVTFLIVGDNMAGAAGSYPSELYRRAECRGLNGSVIFAGWRTDVPEVLSTLDVFVHCPTTWIEGLGLAHLEAMAMGKPTVVSQNGGLTDAAVQGETGFVVPCGDTARLSAAISRLLEEPELAFRYGRNARRRVEALFDARKNTRELEKYFEEYALNRGAVLSARDSAEYSGEGRSFRRTA